MIRPLAGTLILLAALLVPTLAQAEPPTPTEAELAHARALYDEGQRHYELAEYAQAVVKLKESYRLSRAPALLYNLAQAYRQAGDCAQSRRFYASYLRLDVMIDDAARALAEQQRDEMAACESRQRAEAAQNAEAAPLAAEAAARTEPSAAPPAPARPGRGKRIGGLITGGAGLIGLGVGVYFGLAASDASDQAAALVNGGGVWDADRDRRYRSLQDDGERAERWQIVSLAVGGGALVAGGVLYWLGRREGQRSQLSLAPLSDGAMVAWSLTP